MTSHNIEAIDARFGGWPESGGGKGSASGGNGAATARTGKPGNSPGRESAAAGHVRPDSPASPHARPAAHTPAPKAASNKNFWKLPSVHYGHKKPARWYHGVFVYGPAPKHHGHHNAVVVTSNRGKSPVPSRSVDRAGSLSIGGQGGVYTGAYDGGAAYSDFGMGFTANYRMVESLGLELAYTYYNQTFDEGSERETGVFAPSLQLYAFPWSTVSPYASVGVLTAGGMQSLPGPLLA